MRAIYSMARVLGVALLTAGLAAQADAQGVAIYHTSFIVQAPSVQKELKLRKDQSDKLTKSFKEVVTMHQAEDARIKTLPEAEQSGQFAQQMLRFPKAIDKALAEVLKPEQLQRLKQIQLQQAGVQHPDAQTALKLTAEQKEQLKTILSDMFKQKQELFKSTPDFQQATARSKALDKQAKDKAVTVLTAEQKKTWKELTGKPFPTDDLANYQFFTLAAR